MSSCGELMRCLPAHAQDVLEEMEEEYDQQKGRLKEAVKEKGIEVRIFSCAECLVLSCTFPRRICVPAAAALLCATTGRLWPRARVLASLCMRAPARGSDSTFPRRIPSPLCVVYVVGAPICPRGSTSTHINLRRCALHCCRRWVRAPPWTTSGLRWVTTRP